MFEVFSFIFTCISNTVLLMDKFVLWKGFTFFDFSLALILIPCLFKIINIIRVNITAEVSEEVDEYDGYVPKHAKVYHPKHARK